MAERKTPMRLGLADYEDSYEVAASTKIEAGKLVSLNAAGYAKQYAPAANVVAATEIVVVRCEQPADNSDGAAGVLRVTIRGGIFRWNNDTTGKVLTRANIGDAVYGTDAETVQSDAQTQAGGSAECSKVGRLMNVDDDGAWVATGIPFLY